MYQALPTLAYILKAMKSLSEGWDWG